MAKLQSVGIKLKWNPNHGWCATVEFSTMQHAQAECLTGEIGTKYFVQDLSQAIDLAKTGAESIGIEFIQRDGVEPMLYVEGDGEDPKVSLPNGWQLTIQEASKRLGWRDFYSCEVNAD
ncbi:MAG: hypothetical protein O9327_02285 [Polaromonas sp.]|nr:hypothetical protein [Polaromonas sp.]